MTGPNTDDDQDRTQEEGTMTEGRNGEVGQEGDGSDDMDGRDDLADAVDDRAVGTAADGTADTPESVAGTDEPMVDDGLR